MADKVNIKAATVITELLNDRKDKSWVVERSVKNDGQDKYTRCCWIGEGETPPYMLEEHDISDRDRKGIVLGGHLCKSLEPSVVF
jgi:hypothetical protein